MQKSMTGFGKGEAFASNKKFTAEIRSLNSKQLDLSIRLSSQYREIEFELRNMISAALLRGKIDLFISYETQDVQSPAEINTALFEKYSNQLDQLSRQFHLEVSNDQFLASVLRMPEVISQKREECSDDELNAIREAVRKAIEAIDEFRTQEGKILIADLLKRIDLIDSYRVEIEPYEKSRCEVIRQRILSDIKNLGVEVNNERLEQEMIFYLEKLDITEEKVRLKNHCKYFHEVAENEPAAGRKLGFIAQEIGREINTTGSKANNTEIQILVVKMKDELEKIKEQVLNLL